MSNEQQLIAKSRAGCLNAFGELIERSQARLFAPLYRILHNAEDARDALQDTFLLAYQSLDKFQGRADFFTWLYRIGVNAALNFRRKRRRSMRSIDNQDGGDCFDCADQSPSSEPTHALVCEEEASLIWQALGSLPTRDRTILVLKDMEGLRYDDLARLLRVPVGTIRSRLHRARMKLRQLLEEKAIAV